MTRKPAPAAKAAPAGAFDLTRRSAGVLLHPTSLPGPHGSGDLGPEARAFVDFLAAAGQSWWQMLPVNPIGAGILAVFGAAAASAPFTVLHGAGSGILTIARGTVPLAMFGPDNYGYRLGLLGAPSRVAMAAAPLLFGILIDWYGAGVLVFSSAFSIAALIALCALRVPPSPR